MLVWLLAAVSARLSVVAMISVIPLLDQDLHHGSVGVHHESVGQLYSRGPIRLM